MTTEQLDYELLEKVKEHLDDFPRRNKDFEDMQEVIFGNAKTGEKGMKQKVDEMHEILVQAKGLKGFLVILIIIGGAIAVLKGFWGK